MEWQRVLNPLNGGYAAGFLPDKLYQFRRGVDGDVATYKLTDQHPLFNVAGLYWRDPLEKLRA